jgi:hypothetical protein
MSRAALNPDKKAILDAFADLARDELVSAARNFLYGLDQNYYALDFPETAFLAALRAAVAKAGGPS